MKPPDQESDHIKNVRAIRVQGKTSAVITEPVTKEEPLEIKVVHGHPGRRKTMTLAITMRTPGEDTDLVRGFLFTEGIIRKPGHVLSIQPETLSHHSGHQAVIAQLGYDVFIDEKELTRHVYTSSSCGVCGKTSIDLVRQQSIYLLNPASPQISLSYLISCASALVQHQPTFNKTGGNHAAALFDMQMRCIAVREDVGRHNAMDKLIGSAMEKTSFPLDDAVVFVSGRGSFELVQKAIQAGIAVFASVGAASTLAIELAEANNMTLIGFLKGEKCNIYTGLQRIKDLQILDPVH